MKGAVERQDAADGRCASDGRPLLIWVLCGLEPNLVNYYLRVFGWVFLGMGLVLGGVTALALMGLIPLEITIFGRNVDDRSERVRWLVGWLITAVAGLGILRFDRGNCPKA